LLIQLAIGLALTAGSSLLQQSQQPPPSPAQERSSGIRTTVRLGGEQFRSFLVGTVASSGYLVYGREWGNSGKTPNAMTVDVISYGDLPGVVQTGLLVDGEEVTYQTSSGHVTAGYPVAEYEKNSTQHLWHEFYDGTQESASSYL